MSGGYYQDRDPASSRIDVTITGDGSGVALPPIEESVPRGLEPIPRIAGPRTATPGAGTDPSNQESDPK